MWKNEVRIKTIPTMRTNLKKPPVKPKDNKCRQEFEAMKGKIESKAESLRGNAQLSGGTKQGIDTYFNLTGLNRHFGEMRDNIPDEFFCRLLDAIKKITSSNKYSTSISTIGCNKFSICVIIVFTKSFTLILKSIFAANDLKKIDSNNF